jgi:hypothetical protein
MGYKTATLRQDELVPMKELAIFKFDEELALEEMRKPKAPKEVIFRRRVRYGRRTAKYAPQRERASDGCLGLQGHDTQMVSDINARARGQNATKQESKAP